MAAISNQRFLKNNNLFKDKLEEKAITTIIENNEDCFKQWFIAAIKSFI